MPLTSVLSGAKLGVSAFFDAGKALDVGQSLKDAPWHQGVGGGVFLIATIVRINLDVAHGLKDGDTRVHLIVGVQFLGAHQLLSCQRVTQTSSARRTRRWPDARRGAACTTGTSIRRS